MAAVMSIEMRYAILIPAFLTCVLLAADLVSRVSKAFSSSDYYLEAPNVP